RSGRERGTGAVQRQGDRARGAAAPGPRPGLSHRTGQTSGLDCAPTGAADPNRIDQRTALAARIGLNPPARIGTALSPPTASYAVGTTAGTSRGTGGLPIRVQPPARTVRRSGRPPGPSRTRGPIRALAAPSRSSAWS